MGNYKQFSSLEFGLIRTVTINNEPYFVGKDIACALGYSNPSKALTDHVEPEDKLNNDSLSSLGQRGGWLINESGMYSLIMGSKLEKAKKLFEWLRANGYLISRSGESYNMPTQRAMDLELFEVKERTHLNPDGSVRLTKTTKVTGKGQVYFINKFLQN